MSTAILGNPNLFSDEIIAGSASGVGIITPGDWVQWSGQCIVGLNTQASPAYRISGIGIALGSNPVYDELGRALNNSALPVLSHGVVRVSGGNSGTVPLGAAAYPHSTASGIVGATGATGIGPLWLTAPRQSISANPTGALASGVGKVVKVVKPGDATAAQLDIMFDARNLAVDYT